MRDPVRIIVWTLAIAVAGLTALGLGDRMGLGGRVGWVLDLMSHWPKHLFVAGLVVGAIAGGLGKRIAAGIAVAAAAVNLAVVLSVGSFALPQAAPEGARLLRVVSANVHRSEAALLKVVQLAKDYNADIVALYETPDALTLDDYAKLFPGLPEMSLPSTRANGWDLRRRSFIAARGVGPIDVDLFDLSHGVVLRTMHGDVQIVTTHPPSPGDPGLKWDRDRQLEQAGARIDTARPFVVMGDFNSTPWGRAYGLVPGTRAGDPRFDGTFPAGAGWFGLPIDHIRFGGVTLTDYRAGPDVGSDHLPLFATFALPAG